VVIRGHSWSFVVIHGHSWSFVFIRGHSCVLLDKIIVIDYGQTRMEVDEDCQSRLFTCQSVYKNPGTKQWRTAGKEQHFLNKHISPRNYYRPRAHLTYVMHKLYNGLITHSILICSTKQDKHFLLSHPLFIQI
jgi:hypothetical protein